MLRITFFLLEDPGFGILVAEGLARHHLTMEVVFKVKIQEFTVFVCLSTWEHLQCHLAKDNTSTSFVTEGKSP